MKHLVLTFKAQHKYDATWGKSNGRTWSGPEKQCLLLLFLTEHEHCVKSKRKFWLWGCCWFKRSWTASVIFIFFILSFQIDVKSMFSFVRTELKAAAEVMKLEFPASVLMTMSWSSSYKVCFSVCWSQTLPDVQRGERCSLKTSGEALRLQFQTWRD